MKKIIYLLTLLIAANFIFTACTCIDVNRLVLNRSTLTLPVGSTERLVATAFGTISNNNARWTSDDEAVATVDANGVVTGVSVGTAVITVITACGNYSVICEVTVVPIQVTGITLENCISKLHVGETELLIATIIPTNATNQEVAWSSSNPAVATVSNNGEVLAIAVGTTTITATAVENGRTATCVVTVYYIPHYGVVINGIRWTTRNVSSPGTFAPTPESSGMFFQWNRRTGWSATNPGVGIHVDGWETMLEGGTAWYAVNDPCPVGWRIPTADEMNSLNAAGSTWVTNRNGTGVNGRLFGTYPNQIFLPAAGWRHFNHGSLAVVNVFGYYWTSTAHGTASARDLQFNNAGSWAGGNWNRLNGHSIRCVEE